MTWHRYLLISLLLLGALPLLAAPERQFAGVRIGMRPEEVKAVLGEKPDAILIAQPPVIIRTAGLPGEADLAIPTPSLIPGMEEYPKPNTLIFIYNGQEFEIGTSEGTASMGGGPGGSSAGRAFEGKPVNLPVWAYVVRAAKMSLDQQELIYQINETYSIGVVITGRGPEAKVTDIIACSFEPFKVNVGASYNAPVRKLNFAYNNKNNPKLKGSLIEGYTSKGLTLGSKFDDVLKKYKWTEFLYPYIARDVSSIQLANQYYPSKSTSVPVTLTSNNQAAPPTQPSVQPNPMPSESTLPGPGQLPAGTGMVPPAETMSPPPPPPPQPAPTYMPPAMGGGMGNEQAAGEYPVIFTDGDKLNFNAGFTKNCFMLYPNENIAFSIVDFIVVRIHIGGGVVIPPPPPKLKATTP